MSRASQFFGSITPTQIDTFGVAVPFVWTKPSWAKLIVVMLWGAGGGGMGGMQAASGSAKCGGGGGGGGGFRIVHIYAANLGALVNGAVGAGGAGGPGGASASANGYDGGVSSFDQFIVGGGGGGTFRDLSTSWGGGSGSNRASAVGATGGFPAFAPVSGALVFGGGSLDLAGVARAARAPACTSPISAAR